MTTTATHKLHSVTRERVRAIQTTALAQAYADDPTLRAAPSTRPVCLACGRNLPTIDGYCAPHMSARTEGSLYCVSPSDLSLPGK